MVQRPSAAYVLDPADPRAPTHEQWEAMTPEERARMIDMLPTSLPIEEHPPKGDLHRELKYGALDALEAFFGGAGRRMYVSSGLIVFYPGERPFVPDLLAVRDVDPHPRTRWVVDAEGRGLDVVIQILVPGDDEGEADRERSAQLGIREHFVFDRARTSLTAHRLTADGGAYQRLAPQAGRYPSEVLGLDVAMERGKLRFFIANAPLEDKEEQIARLEAMLLREQLGRDEADGKLVEALAENERLRGR